MPLYFANIPQATDKVATSQPQLLTNFSYINSTLSFDHAWEGSFVSTEPAGSHDQVSMPNRVAALSGPLPAAVAARMYCFNGNIFSWDGTSTHPVSGTVVYISPITLNTTYQTILTLPATPGDLTGIIMVSIGATSDSGSNVCGCYSFFRRGSGGIAVPATPSIDSTNLTGTASKIYFDSSSNTTIQAKRGSGSSATSIKCIYWPI